MADLGSGFQGAAGGALAGSALSGGNPLGGLIGGGVGLLGGLFGNPAQDQQRQMLMDYYNSIGSQQASQAGYSGFRQNQSQLINQLEAMSQGQGPSLAAQQFQQATDRNMASQQAVAASGRGGPMANLTAANNMAGLGAQAAQGSAIARTGEELGALGQLGGVINQGRGADEGVNMFNAGAQNQMVATNDAAKLGALGQINALNQQPTMGQQILSGGAGLFALGASQNKGGNGFNGFGNMPAFGSNGLFNPSSWGQGQAPGGGNSFGWTPSHG